MNKYSYIFKLLNATPQENVLSPEVSYDVIKSQLKLSKRAYYVRSCVKKVCLQTSNFLKIEIDLNRISCMHLDDICGVSLHVDCALSDTYADP